MERKLAERTVRVVRGDITEADVDAFVLDITSDLKLVSGVGAGIQQRGGVAIQKELDAIGSCPVGEAVVTGAGLLKAVERDTLLAVLRVLLGRSPVRAAGRAER